MCRTLLKIPADMALTLQVFRRTTITSRCWLTERHNTELQHFPSLSAQFRRWNPPIYSLNTTCQQSKITRPDANKREMRRGGGGKRGRGRRGNNMCVENALTVVGIRPIRVTAASLVNNCRRGKFVFVRLVRRTVSTFTLLPRRPFSLDSVTAPRGVFVMDFNRH